MSNERRKHSRIAADIATTIVDGDVETKGVIANLSENGGFLRAEVRPELHRPIRVQFILKPDHTLCSASGKVAWQAPHGIGVTFEAVSDGFVGFIRDLVKAAESINPAPKQELLERVLGEPDVEIG